MKRFVLIFLVLALFCQLSQNTFTLVKFYLNQDYISSNLCVNRFDAMPICKGQCYLSKELKKSEKNEKKQSNIKEKNVQYYLVNDTIIEYNLISNIHVKHVVYPVDNFYSLSTNLRIFHPPILI